MIRTVLIFVLICGLSGCASKFKTYDGPEVTQLIVMKSDRQLYLMHHGTVLKSYRIDLGFAPLGHKQFEGDGRTPEGSYVIDRRNPDSNFHLSIGISYPNEEDKDYAESLGLDPGKDIFIHGGPRRNDRKGRDWTAGCISVKDRQIEDIYAMVQDGTPIDIFP